LGFEAKKIKKYLLQFPLRSVWVVPVMLSYPRIGPIGQTGVVAVDIETGSVTGWTLSMK
jgi:hypothetical protein